MSSRRNRRNQGRKNKGRGVGSPKKSGSSRGEQPATQPKTTLGGTSLGSPKTGSSLGGPKKGTSLGGASLGGPKKGSSLGGATLGGPKKGSSLGGASLGGPKKGSSLGGASLGGPRKMSSLGGPKKGSSLGGPKKGSSLGGASLGGPRKTSSLGGPKKGSSLGGASLGGPKKGSSLGGASLGGPKQGSSLGGASLGGPKKSSSLGGPKKGASLGGPAKKSPTAAAKKAPKTKSPANKKKASAGRKKKSKKPRGMAGRVAQIRAEQERKKAAAEAERKRIEEEERRLAEEEEKLRLHREQQKAERAEKKRLAKIQAKKEAEAAELRMRQARYAPNKRIQEGAPVKARTIENVKSNKKKKRRGFDYDQLEDNSSAEKEAEAARKKAEAEAKAAKEAAKEEAADNWEDDVPDAWDAEEAEPAAVPSSWDDEEDEDGAKPSEESTTSSAKPAEPEKKVEPEKPKEPVLTKKQKKKLEEEKRKQELAKKKAENLKGQNKKLANMRSPILCVLGHVDHGKTKLLDRMRRSKVQEGEAGGITQQIGATFFPLKTLKDQTARLNARYNVNIQVPGLLIVDTPGHESFSNLRRRGSSLCDIAILVVDIMQGLQPQTIESIGLLVRSKTPFVVAVNKVDMLYGWQATEGAPIRESLKKQNSQVMMEYERRLNHVIAELAGQELNSKLYWENKQYRDYISLVPTSAMTGEGVPDLMLLVIQLTQKLMGDRLLQLASLECTILEVKSTVGFGTTLDVVLSNGTLNEGDRIVVCGMTGAIVTTIRALLQPAPMSELRDRKSQYKRIPVARASIGLKIAAQDLDQAVAGSHLYVVNPGDDIEELKQRAMSDIKGLGNYLKPIGVYVVASTLGSLEALLEFLKSEDIPVSGISIGDVYKKDVIKASTMLEHEFGKYAVILAFDVKISPEASTIANQMKIRIFDSDIIYKLKDDFSDYIIDIASAIEKKQGETIFPFQLRILPEFIIAKHNPIILGVHVECGRVLVGTKIVIPSKGNLVIGEIVSIEKNNASLDEAKAGEDVAIRIENPGGPEYTYERQFDFRDDLYSLITRKNIDALKTYHRDWLKKNKAAFNCVVFLKKQLKIL